MFVQPNNFYYTNQIRTNFILVDSLIHQFNPQIQNFYNLNRRIVMNKTSKLREKTNFYQFKRSKEPDYLLNLANKMKNSQENENCLDEDYQDMVKKKMLQKRIDAILKIGSANPKVSDPVPFAKKKWISPFAQLNQDDKFQALREVKVQKRVDKFCQEEAIQKVVNILDLNKRLKYFGQYLQVTCNGSETVKVGHMTSHESRMSFLKKRFHNLQKTIKPKLCIMNYPMHQKVTFVNYLENDQFYQNIMRKDDDQLMRLLISSLQTNSAFTLTSYMTFYDIFVWQNANKLNQIEFVAKLLMKDSTQRPIIEIGRTIDRICKKIYIENFSKSLQNFNEVMKKLLFGDDYEYSSRKQYYLTRKALKQSLQKNQQCISIFINIFYAG